MSEEEEKKKEDDDNHYRYRQLEKEELVLALKKNSLTYEDHWDAFWNNDKSK